MCADHGEHQPGSSRSSVGAPAGDGAGDELEPHQEGAPLTKAAPDKAPSPLAWLAMKMVRGYQKYFSAFTPPVCRFHPTCSQYTLIAIQRYGFFKGGWMGFWRIMRCHPFHPGGYDPVP